MEPFTEIDHLQRRPGTNDCRRRSTATSRPRSGPRSTSSVGGDARTGCGPKRCLSDATSLPRPSVTAGLPRLQRALELRERNPELYQLVLGGLTARRAMMDQARGLSRMDKDAPDFGRKTPRTARHGRPPAVRLNRCVRSLRRRRSGTAALVERHRGLGGAARAATRVNDERRPRGNRPPRAAPRAGEPRDGGARRAGRWRRATAAASR